MAGSSRRRRVGKKDPKRHHRAHEHEQAAGDQQVRGSVVAARGASAAPPAAPMKKKAFEEALGELEFELVKLQEWIKQRGLKVVVVFEGRDTAGKGGVIKRITARLSPRVV